ncbi:MAG: DM13 domain-containing protein [Rhizobiaceae bacterium]
MGRWLAVFFLGGIFGTAFGVAVGIFAFPYIFPPPEAKEELARAGDGKPLASGAFIHANPSDPIHYGAGGVRVFERLVYLEEDFEVGPGPDYHVYLVPKPAIRSTADVDNTMYVDLGRLRAFKGSQNYAVPAGLDLKDFPSVVIWCQRFGVLIAPADLEFAS